MSKRNYINKEDFEREVISFQDKLKKYHDSLNKDKKEFTYDEKYGLHLVNSKLCKMIMDLAKHNLQSYKYNSLAYDDKQDIHAQVVLEMLKVLNSYNRDYFKDHEDKKPNTFGFYTRSTQLCISKQLGKMNERKAKINDFILFLDDIAMDFGNDEDNDNFKTNAKGTRDYVDSLDGGDLHYYKKAQKKLPKRITCEDNIGILKSLVLGINQYNS